MKIKKYKLSFCFVKNKIHILIVFNQLNCSLEIRVNQKIVITNKVFHDDKNDKKNRKIWGKNF